MPECWEDGREGGTDITYQLRGMVQQKETLKYGACLRVLGGDVFYVLDSSALLGFSVLCEEGFIGAVLVLPLDIRSRIVRDFLAALIFALSSRIFLRGLTVF